MGIELPSELADVAAQAGVRWPQADEDGMRLAAAAWREAGTRVSALASDSDGSAGHALGAMRGETADAARRHWDTFLGPGGHLTATARGCHAAADRLEHAANQVGAAKVEIVRHLVTLAKNNDAAHQAAAAGHPAALAGMDTAVRGTAANVAHVHQTLTRSVRLDSGADVQQAQPLVPASPGAQHGSEPVSSPLGPPGAGTDPAGHGGLPVGGHLDQAGGGRQDLLAGVGPHLGGGDTPGDLGPGLPSAAHDIAGQGGVAGAAGGLAGHPPVDPHQLDPESTGPIPAGHAGRAAGFDPGHGVAAGGSNLGATGDGAQGGWGPAGSAPNVVHQSSAGAVDPPPPAAAQPGVAAQPAAGPVEPGGAGGFGGSTGAGGGPPVAGGGFATGPGAPGGQVPPGRQGIATGAGPAPGMPAPPGARAGQPGMAGGRGTPDLVADVGRIGERDRSGLRPGPATGAYQAPVPDRAGQAQPKPARAHEQPGGSLALFVVHMFPIGHLPVPANRPARQLPPPTPELDYAAGLRFPPQDHPRSALVHDGDAVRKAMRGGPPVACGPGLPVDEPLVGALADGHDPLGGEHERDWDHRFLVRAGDDDRTTEYAWPPAELYPEGGSDVGEPVVLAEGTRLDRFGSPEGRVLAPEGTPFARRSLPPQHLTAGYHRYLVLRPLPVWQAVSAAWFGQPGGGVRYRATYPVADLVALGWLAEVAEPPATGNPDGQPAAGGEREGTGE